MTADVPYHRVLINSAQLANPAQLASTHLKSDDSRCKHPLLKKVIKLIIPIQLHNFITPIGTKLIN